MSRDTAERWVVISAVTVALVYAYRRFTDTSAPATSGKGAVLGIGGVPSLGQFGVAWGFTYLVVAAMATAAPGLGGGFAILIMTADLLTNTADLTKHITAQTGQTGSSSSSTTGAVTSLATTQTAGTTAAAAGATSVAKGATNFLQGIP